jgi:ribonucrease Y
VYGYKKDQTLKIKPVAVHRGIRMEKRMVYWGLAIFTTLAALGLGYFWHHHLVKVHGESALKKADDIVRDARKEAEVIVREGKAGAIEEMHRLKDAFERETKRRRDELNLLTEKFNEREIGLFAKVAQLDKKEENLEERHVKLDAERQAVKDQRLTLDGQHEEQRVKLQEVAQMGCDEARSVVLKRMENEARREGAGLLRRIQREVKEEAEATARKIITLAIERYAAPIVSEVTTSIVKLPSEEMKGRIIGKEGRNIRSFEQEAGVTLIIDDTPGSVTISGYDPLRREIAKVALLRLVEDGRIHPASIEETLEKVRQETEQAIHKAGEDAVYTLGLSDVAPELIPVLGRLKYRHSYSQNILDHSIEMAHIMATMAGELHLDPMVAKRVGLFHDIGKALTHEVEGSHAQIGADLIEKAGEDPEVVNAVAAHHHEVEATTIFAYLASAADAITAARPGARMENTQHYLDRLGDLEEIANSFDGVKSTYAIMAGRELRVIVEPAEVDDVEAMQLARSISARIQERMDFPGQIKVVVIRESRCVEYAR